MQVYRFMDIGTAKPRPEMLEKLPHHLIDVVNPDVSFNVGKFVGWADRCVRAVVRRRKYPVLSGGTAYYIKNFVYGLTAAPPSAPEVRDEVLAWIERVGAAEAYERLARVDPEYASRIGVRDASRITRAWEVIRTSGRPLSDFSLSQSLRREYSFLFVGLWRPRLELRRCIERRIESMFRQGLMEEVKELLRRGYRWEHPGMRGIGYREFSRFQRGCLRTDQLKELIASNTGRYAKRQMTFFRSLPCVKWFAPEDLSALTEEIQKFWEGAN
jgi:tRNA dimethylallyltransferase